ncbi:MAG: thiamine-phosphate kinase [Verrucomicrobiota bacterium]|nr:thiamine-phosphate kinase [Verrucomicrobiota bacterium]
MKLRESGKGRIRLRELGEDRLIAQLVARLQTHPAVIAGPGDDCAVIAGPEKGELLLFKTDCVVERVHFQPNEKPSAIGWKAMARTLSDFAAMAGQPHFGLVTLIAPATREARWIKEIYRWLERVARRFEVAIVGGETSSTEGPVVLSISAIGTVEKDRWVSRSGGQAGDALYVTGRLGGSLRRKHLNFIPRIEEARWLSGNFQIHAMMDLSDGLGADLPRLAKASGVGFEIDENSIPRNRSISIRQALNDGEDYELLFALSPNDSRPLATKWRKKFTRLPLTRIGFLIPRSAFHIPHSFRGYLHFQ